MCSKCTHQPTHALIYVRLVLAESDVEFEQPAFSMGDAAAQSAYFADCRSKGGNLTTNVPMLHIDGRYLTQSAAVLTYCARKFGSVPYEPNAGLQGGQPARGGRGPALVQLQACAGPLP